MNERWKPVVGYEDTYSVSDMGRVRRESETTNTFCGRILLSCKGRRDYKIVFLSKNGISKRRSIHRLVAEAFIPNPERKEQVNHINGIANDNRAENLEWVTAQENVSHQVNVLGTNSRGDENGQSKLSNKQARVIAFAGTLPAVERKKLASIWGVNERTIRDVSCGRSFKSVIAGARQ